MIQVTDQRYLNQINEPFRGSFSAEVKLFFKSGTRTFTDDDIFTISESETANIVADENPTQSTEITLSNYNHEFDINGTSGYFRDIADGIECQYRFGFHVLNEDGTEDTVWLDWKRRWCSGEATLAEKQVTFTVSDVFSTNDDDVEAYMSANYGLIVTNTFNKSTYPKKENGSNALSFDSDLFNIVTYYQPTYTKFNEIIQSVAFASGKQFYIDHSGVVHIDDDRASTTDVHLTIGDYFEDNEAGKEKKVKKITVSYFVPEDSTVNARPDFVREMNGTGESVTINNDFICSVEDGNRVMSYLVNYYEKRGTFTCTFRGDPRLEPLDVITIDILNSDNTVQTVTGTIISIENTFDGTFESNIECRYLTSDQTDDIASITGAENFVYPLDSDVANPATVTLTCTTSIANPTSYVWDYYNIVTSSWTQIGTSSTLSIPYDSTWLTDDVATTFRCTVDDTVSASVSIRRIFTTATYTYLGIQQTAPSNPTVGDYYLAPTGYVYLYNGDTWVTTSRSDLLINAVADGKTLTGIENTPLGQLIASMQGADGKPGADGQPGADGAPAKSLTLSADMYNFHTDAEGNVKPNQVITLTVQKQNVLDDIVWSDNKNINVPTNTLTYQFKSSIGEEVTPINELKGIPYSSDTESYDEYILGTEENITVTTAYDGETVVSNGNDDGIDIPIPDGTYSAWVINGYFRIKTPSNPGKFYLRYKTNFTNGYHVVLSTLAPEVLKCLATTADDNGNASFIGDISWEGGQEGFLAMYFPYAIFAPAGTTTGVLVVNTQPVLVDIAKNQDIFTSKGLTTDEEIKAYLDSIPYEDFASRDSVESITYPDNLTAELPYGLPTDTQPTQEGITGSADNIIFQSFYQGTGTIENGAMGDIPVHGIPDGTYGAFSVIGMIAINKEKIDDTHKFYIRATSNITDIIPVIFSPNRDNTYVNGMVQTGNIFSLVIESPQVFFSTSEGDPVKICYLPYMIFTDSSITSENFVITKPVIVDVTANESFFTEQGLLTDDAIREYLDSIPYEKFGTTETIDTPTAQINPALDGTPTIFTVTAGDLSSSVQIGYVQDGEQGEQGKSIDHVDTFYLATSQGSGVTVETEGWTSEPQTITNDKKYLWIYQDIYYSDNTVEQTIPYISGVYGDKGDSGSADNVKMLTLVPSATTYEVSSRNVVQKEQTIIVEARVTGLSGSEIKTFTYPANFVADADVSTTQPSETTDVIWFKGTGSDVLFYTGDDNTYSSATVSGGTVTVGSQSIATNLPDGSYNAHVLNPEGIITNTTAVAHFAHKLYIRCNTETNDVDDWWASIKLTGGTSYIFGMELNSALAQPVFSGIGSPNLSGNITIGSAYLFKLTTDEWAFRSITAKDIIMVDITENQTFFTERGLTTDAQIKEYLDNVEYVEFGRTINIVDNMVWTVTPEQANGYVVTASAETTTLIIRIPVQSDLTGFAVQCSVEGVGKDITYINSVATGEPTPRFFEMRGTPPTTSENNGERFITGDHYITSAGVPMTYNETSNSWNEAQEGDEYFSLIMENCGNYMLSNGVEITTSMTALYGYFNTIYSNSIVSDAITAKKLTLNNQGTIRSTITLPDGTTKGYEPGDGQKYGVAGFCIMADGTAEFYNMYAYGIFAQGSFEADAMYTAAEIPAISSSTVTSAYRTSWNSQSSQLVKDLKRVESVSYTSLLVMSEDNSEAYFANDYPATKRLYLYNYNIDTKTLDTVDVSNAYAEVLNNPSKYKTEDIDMEYATVYKDPRNRMCISFYATSSTSDSERVILSFRYNEDTNIINMDTRFLTNCLGAIKTIFTKNGEWIAYNGTCGLQLSDWGYSQWHCGYGTVVSDGSKGDWLGNGQSGTCSGWTYNNEYGDHAEKLWDKAVGTPFSGTVPTANFGCVYDEVNDRVWWWNILDGCMLPVEFGQDGNFRHGSRYYEDSPQLGNFTFTKTSNYTDGIHTQNGLTVITYGGCTAWAIIQVQSGNGRWASSQIDFGTEKRFFAGFDKDYLYARDSGGYIWRCKATVSSNDQNVYSFAKDWEKINTYTTSTAYFNSYALGDQSFIYSTLVDVYHLTVGQSMDNVITYFSTVINKLPSNNRPSIEPLSGLANCTGTLRRGSASNSISQVQCTSNAITIVVSGGTSYTYTRGERYDAVDTISINNLVISAVAASVNVRNLFPQADSSYDIGTNTNRFRYGYFDTVYVTTIGSGSNKVSNLYATRIGSSSYRVSYIYANNLTLGSSRLSTNGYTSLPNGLLLQWGLSEHGTYSGGEFDARNIYFPVAFSTSPYAVLGCQVALDGSSRDDTYFGYLSNTTAAGNPGVAYSSSRFTLTAYNKHDYFWMAVGRA